MVVVFYKFSFPHAGPLVVPDCEYMLEPLPHQHQWLNQNSLVSKTVHDRVADAPQLSDFFLANKVVEYFAQVPPELAIELFFSGISVSTPETGNPISCGLTIVSRS